ncbi:MAG: putative structural protein [Prokaryotic dsDNA virus sp.]|nr:MAG: putative structural protein [Prokaryotic dsDNA virus sp.]|tara:strand:+ start:29194 stop:29694 length:501 start_codon:yes stop_codon:yes gene_type:complete
MQLANYIPEDVTITVAGFVSLDGLADGTFVNITKDLIPFTSRRTTDGVISRIYNRDTTYTIDITLYSGSESNDTLSRLLLIDETSQMGMAPIMIKDNSGTSLFFALTSWIEDLPPLTLSNKFETRTWRIKATQAVLNIGGNMERGSDIDNMVRIATAALPSLAGLI